MGRSLHYLVALEDFPEESLLHEETHARRDYLVPSRDESAQILVEAVGKLDIDEFGK